MINDMGKDIKFPKGFLWGTGTSAHQFEGNNHNNWSQWEKTSARRKAQNAKLKKWPDFILKRHPSPLQEENYISGRACDHYNRYGEDFDLAKKLNNNAHRFSIEWSRIEPEEGKFNQAEIEHYYKVINALHERGLEPFVTLWHWTMPVWFVQKGAFEKRENIKYFVRFCETMVREFKNEVKFWIVLNEPNTYAGMSYFVGVFPPQKKNPLTFLRVLSNLAKAHRAIYDVVHDVQKDSQVGIAQNTNYFEGWAAPFMRWFWHHRFLNQIQDKQDFIGINYYYRLLVKGLNFDAGQGSRSDRGWEIYPKGIYYVLKDLSCYKRPIYITENGLADARDKYRTNFIIYHSFWIYKAIEAGVDVRGCFHWSLLDFFEWEEGFWPRFGLVEIDYETLERKLRSSSFVYGETAKANAITPEIIKMAGGGENYD